MSFLACASLALAMARPISDEGIRPQRPLLLLHVMPWFEINKNVWGWHWKMSLNQTELSKNGRVASHYRPLLGPYDSADPAVVEVHILWMKVGGFDGVLANWYGTQSHFDYPMIHQRTQLLFGAAAQHDLKIGVVYEDQTVKHALNNGLIQASETLRVARETGSFLKTEWLGRKEWWTIGGKPVLTVFGPQFFDETHWSALRNETGPVNFLTLHHKRVYADGVFDWPLPSQGLGFTNDFWNRTATSPIQIPVAYPRFHDYYEEAGQSGYAELPDQDGRTYRQLLNLAISQKPEAVQIATWNDWQEGTQIEPSIEHQYRDLITTQQTRRKIDSQFKFVEADLELPLRVYRLRKKGSDKDRLDRIVQMISSGRTAEARKSLAALER